MAPCRIKEVAVHFLPVKNRVPLKFGAQVVTEVSCARVRLVVEDSVGRRATGWGETPLAVAWVWPSEGLEWSARQQRLQEAVLEIARAASSSGQWSHPMEFAPQMLAAVPLDDLPLLARLCCLSPFDLAAFDAFGSLAGAPVFSLLDWPLEPWLGSGFAGRQISDYLRPAPRSLPVWHLVGGLDPLDDRDLTGGEPEDGHPLTLRQWIARDGLRCLKVKLTGTDLPADFHRYAAVGSIAADTGVSWLSADFNCTVTDPGYVVEFLDRLLAEQPETYARTLYIEQPFPHDLHRHQIDVRPVSARKPLFLDESAHDWEHVRLGRELGWSGVALKTCKTLSGALLSLCWARQHGMSLMVQDLTNPMLAQISHVLLAAHAGTLMGVESNSMQFYPAASAPEAAVHPGLFRRREGRLDLSSLGGTGFGYRVEEIQRRLPPAALELVSSAG